MARQERSPMASHRSYGSDRGLHGIDGTSGTKIINSGTIKGFAVHGSYGAGIGTGSTLTNNASALVEGYVGVEVRGHVNPDQFRHSPEPRWLFGPHDRSDRAAERRGGLGVRRHDFRRRRRRRRGGWCGHRQRHHLQRQDRGGPGPCSSTGATSEFNVVGASLLVSKIELEGAPPPPGSRASSATPGSGIRRPGPCSSTPAIRSPSPAQPTASPARSPASEPSSWTGAPMP